MSADRWRVRHPGIGVLAYDSEAEARVAAGTAGEVLPPDAVPARDVDAGPVVDGWREACDEAVAESGRMEAERDRLREKYVAEHEAHTSTMFERDQLRESARAAGWVTLAEVLDALQNEAHQIVDDPRDRRIAHAYLEARAYLAGRFGVKEES